MIEQESSGPSMYAEYIVNKKTVDGVDYYLVKWLGYGEEENTWEPFCNIKACWKEIEEFNRLNDERLRRIEERKWKEEKEKEEQKERDKEKEMLEAEQKSNKQKPKPTRRRKIKKGPKKSSYRKMQTVNFGNRKNKKKRRLTKQHLDKMIQARRNNRDRTKSLPNSMPNPIIIDSAPPSPIPAPPTPPASASASVPAPSPPSHSQLISQLLSDSHSLLYGAITNVRQILCEVDFVGNDGKSHTSKLVTMRDVVNGSNRGAAINMMRRMFVWEE